jgi:predicted transcriptional regulator
MAKVLVSIDDHLLRRVDRVAKSRGLTRSAFIAQLAERELLRERGPGASPAVRRALRELEKVFAEHPGPNEDSTAAIRAERDAR